jgi:glycine dehydrogenase subunit 1
MYYISHKKEDIEKITKILNITEINELLNDIPSSITLKKNGLNLEKGKTEAEILNLISEIKKMNVIENNDVYLGGGIYNHFIPSIVESLSNRSEFLTAYTPYQAELSQGILQWIFEYQTIIAKLTGMEVVNASLYDAGTSVFEAVKLALKVNEKNRLKNKKNLLISKFINPEYIEVLQTSFKIHSKNNEQPINLIFFESLEELKTKINDDSFAVLVSNPNFIGQIEDIEKITELAHKFKALSIVNIYPISLGILKKPGELGVDIVVGEGQSLGMPMCIGGATFGIFATKKEFVRFMPGRIVGKTADKNGKEGFVLTMQAREQHIRRDKAFSNICSNHANYALKALIYLSAIGNEGLKNVAILNMKNAYYFAEKLASIKNQKNENIFEIVYKDNFFNEFLLKYNFSNFDEFDKKLKEKNIILGLNLNKIDSLNLNSLNLKNHWIVCTTELNTKEKIDKTIEKIKEAIN